MDLIMEKVNAREENQSILLGKGAIAGVRVYHHTLVSSSIIKFNPNLGYWHILILVEGNAMLETSEASYSYDERVSFIPALDQELVVKALSNIQLLEIQLDLREGDLGELASYNVKFPVIQMYKNAKQYWDHAKSKKTINRIMVEQRHVPRFAMGSVESYGVDRVAPHGHPLLDQFFFSFPENNMDVLIDGERVPMEGNVLLYIPLGSDHGVDVEEGQHMHYVWIDFMVNQDAMNALDKGHIPTGTLRSFNEVESGK